MCPENVHGLAQGLEKPRQTSTRAGPGGRRLTISAFSLVRVLIFSSILWMLCRRSSFFLFIRLFFSTRGFSCISVSRERFSCSMTDTEGRAALRPNEWLATPRRPAEIQPAPSSGWSCHP